MLDKIVFVAMLFIMGLACLIGAFAEHSPGWFAGAVVFFGIAFYAKRALRREVEDDEPQAERSFLSLMAWSMGAVGVGMLAIFFLLAP